MNRDKLFLVKPSQHHLFACLSKTNSKTRFDYLKDLQLADSGFTDEIDLLIGSDFYWSVVTGKTKIGKNNEPVVVETKFAWVLNGPVTSFEICTLLTFESEYSHVLLLNTDQSVKNKNINFNVNRFWDLETIGIREKKT